MTLNALTDLDELVHHSALPPNPLAVFAVGSVARGWANSRSDYDLNIVSKRPWRGKIVRTLVVPLRTPSIPTLELVINGRRWELKYWTDSQVDEMMGKVTWDEFEEGSSSSKALVENEELFLERLTTCRPLSGDEWVETRRRELAATAFRAFVTTQSLAEADASIEDALGQVAAGDTASAVLSAHKALGHAVDALLESYGNYGSRTPKWRARRFQETAPHELTFEDYWHLETMRGYDPESPAGWVHQVVALCKQLALIVEIR